MTRPRIVTSSVTFLWKPPRYAVTWADTPDDVPSFDPSRGADPYLGLSDSDLELDAQLRPEKKKLKEELKNKIKVERSDKRLGGNEPPPLVVQYKARPKRFVRAKNGPGYSVREWSNYPRLVRKEAYSSDTSFKDRPVHLEVAELRSQLDDEHKLRERIIELGTAYAPMLSKTKMSDTLEAWKLLIKETGFFLDILSEDQRIKESAGKRYNRHFIEFVDKQLTEVEGSTLSMLNQLERSLESGKAKNVKNQLASLLWDVFAVETEGCISASSVPGQLFVKCGVRGWLYKELWDSMTSHRKIKRCLACDKVFYPKSDKAKFCGGNCRRMYHYYENKR